MRQSCDRLKVGKRHGAMSAHANDGEKGFFWGMKSPDQSMTRRRKGLVRISLLLIAAAVIAGIAAAFGMAQNYGYLRASILTGPLEAVLRVGRALERSGQTRDGSLTVVPTPGSIENISRLTAGGRGCSEMFALIQDGTPIPPGSRIQTPWSAS